MTLVICGTLFQIKTGIVLMVIWEVIDYLRPSPLMRFIQTQDVHSIQQPVDEIAKQRERERIVPPPSTGFWRLCGINVIFAVLSFLQKPPRKTAYIHA